MPVITLVIYFGSESWSAPLSLKEMYSEADSVILAHAAEVINVVTVSKLKYPEGKGSVNMCLAIQQMREESRIEGAVLMCKDLGISLAETIKRIAEKFQLSEKESSDTVSSIGKKRGMCSSVWAHPLCRLGKAYY